MKGKHGRSAALRREAVAQAQAERERSEQADLRLRLNAAEAAASEATARLLDLSPLLDDLRDSEAPLREVVHELKREAVSANGARSDLRLIGKALLRDLKKRRWPASDAGVTAVANVSRALHRLGIVGLPSGLGDSDIGPTKPMFSDDELNEISIPAASPYQETP